MKKKLIALLLGSTLVLAACGGGNDEPANDNANDAANNAPEVEETNNNDTVSAIDPEDVFKKRCSQCHGQNLEGGLGADLTEVGSRLSKDEILDVIAEGTDDGMAPNLIVGEEADAVAEWLSEKK